MPEPEISVVPIGAKVCKPFLLDVMVFSPESGYKFAVSVERSCTRDADPLWKLVFDLYRVADKEVQVVHVSYTAKEPVEQQGVQRMISGVTPKQADILVSKVHPAVKRIEGKKKPTAEEKKKIAAGMSEALTSVEL